MEATLDTSSSADGTEYTSDTGPPTPTSSCFPDFESDKHHSGDNTPTIRSRSASVTDTSTLCPSGSLEGLSKDEKLPEQKDEERQPEIVVHNIVPFTDATLELYVDEGDTSKPDGILHRYRVSRGVLTLVSAYFRSLPSSAWEKNIRLDDIDPDMLLLTLQMLHHQYAKLPKGGFSTSLQAFKFVKIIDKLGLVGCVYPKCLKWVDAWIMPLLSEAYVAYVLQYEERLERAIEFISSGISVLSDASDGLPEISYNDVRFVSKDYRRDELKRMFKPRTSDRLSHSFSYADLPSEIRKRAEDLRQKKVNSVKALLTTTMTSLLHKRQQNCRHWPTIIEKYSNRTSPQDGSVSAQCDMMQLGHLLYTLKDLNINPSDDKSNVWHDSIENIEKTLSAIGTQYLDDGSDLSHVGCSWVHNLDELRRTSFEKGFSDNYRFYRSSGGLGYYGGEWRSESMREKHRKAQAARKREHEAAMKASRSPRSRPRSYPKEAVDKAMNESTKSMRKRHSWSTDGNEEYDTGFLTASFRRIREKVPECSMIDKEIWNAAVSEFSITRYRFQDLDKTRFTAAEMEEYFCHVWSRCEKEQERRKWAVDEAMEKYRKQLEEKEKGKGNGMGLDDVVLTNSIR
ncbi:hypothetical protein BJ508DRAFT_412272 [Ascobolus immersus RN42]|uniref:BTB domain-containing protein n=1 Tax=Ascobolus immersus RN42 TaxID=1160509 RepID=A0A3N4ILX6_ASCIM|nr:hypothetical protein BJ508DRAFT_412272 [Ascobolus immersus RN42]